MMRAISKGESLLTCMKKKLKDKWVTSYEVRNECLRGGSYTRGVLEEATDIGIIERRKEIKRRVLYRIDPINGELVCPLEPDVPYEDSVCSTLEEIIENCAQARYEGRNEKLGYCDLLHSIKVGRHERNKYSNTRNPTACSIPAPNLGVTLSERLKRTIVV